MNQPPAAAAPPTEPAPDKRVPVISTAQPPAMPSAPPAAPAKPDDTAFAPALGSAEWRQQASGAVLTSAAVVSAPVATARAAASPLPPGGPGPHEDDEPTEVVRKPQGWRPRKQRSVPRLHIGRHLASEPELDLLQLTGTSFGFPLGRNQVGFPVTLTLSSPSRCRSRWSAHPGRRACWPTGRCASARRSTCSPTARRVGRTWVAPRPTGTTGWRCWSPVPPPATPASADAPVLILHDAEAPPPSAEPVPWQTRVMVLHRFTPHRAEAALRADVLLLQRLAADEAAAIAAQDATGEAMTRADLAATYLELGRGAEAREHLYRALEYHRSTGDRAMETSTLESLGTACFRFGDFSEALRHFQAGAALCAGRDPFREGALRSNLGNTLAAKGFLHDALASLRVGLDLSRQAGNVDGQASALTDIGDVHRRLGDCETALDHLQRTLELAVPHGLTPKVAYVHHQIGKTYLDLGSYPEATAHLQTARQVVAKVGGPAAESEVLVDLGAAHRDVGDFATARTLLDEGLRLATTQGERHQQALALRELAELHQLSGREALARDTRARAEAAAAEVATPTATVA
ncbi:tetratricopeptide repeat protein [Saccharopolyspora sp. NPDC000359]|uniref:tetratricopeptide repeat protein n=1 Tax=Saccharopolyspora sp. NPDC000359 TaxID=3154251 RepID=UPI00331C976F